MITQTPISVRIQSNLLKDLDIEASLGYRKRNALINDSVRFYLKYKDARRRTRCYENLTDRFKIEREFIKELFPEMIAFLDPKLYIQHS